MKSIRILNIVIKRIIALILDDTDVNVEHPPPPPPPSNIKKNEYKVMFCVLLNVFMKLTFKITSSLIIPKTSNLIVNPSGQVF